MRDLKVLSEGKWIEWKMKKIIVLSVFYEFLQLPLLIRLTQPRGGLQLGSFFLKRLSSCMFEIENGVRVGTSRLVATNIYNLIL